MVFADFSSGFGWMRGFDACLSAESEEIELGN